MNDPPYHLQYERAEPRQALFRAEHCADAIVTHLAGLIETRQIRRLKRLARELHEIIQAERKRHRPT